MGSLILMAVALAAVSQPFAAAGMGLMAVAVLHQPRYLGLATLASMAT